MNTLSKKKELLKIYIKSYTILLLFVGSAVGAYFLKQLNDKIIFYIVFILGLICLHALINRSMILLIRFNQIKNAVLYREDSYLELTIKELIINSVFLAPVTIMISIGIYNTTNLILQIIMFFLIFIFIIIGETAKYRYALYKNWYDENLRNI